MGTLFLTKGAVREGFFAGALSRIRELQRDNGAIPWYDNGVIDPWNHTEAAMGLTVLGELEAARAAYRFLAETQLPDGNMAPRYLWTIISIRATARARSAFATRTLRPIRPPASGTITARRETKTSCAPTGR